LADQLASRLDMTACAAWLKDQHGLRGGGKLLLQGGGQQLDANFCQSLKKWVGENTKK
jgi:hypothetical protein